MNEGESERENIERERGEKVEVYIYDGRVIHGTYFTRSFSLPVSNQNSHNSISLLFQLAPISFPRSQNLSHSQVILYLLFLKKKIKERREKRKRERRKREEKVDPSLHSFHPFPIQLLVLKKLKVTGHKSLQFKHTRKVSVSEIEKKEISPSIKCLSIGREGFFVQRNLHLSYENRKGTDSENTME